MLFGLIGTATADTTITFWGYAYYQDVNYLPDNVPLPNTSLRFSIYNSFNDAFITNKTVTTDTDGYFTVTATVPTNAVGYDVSPQISDCAHYTDPINNVMMYRTGGQTTALVFPNNLTAQLSNVIYDNGN